MMGAPADLESRDERFARLLREHGAALTRLASAYERDTDDREDLMQEIAFAVWRALPLYRGECSERTFIFRIGHNRAVTHLARGRVRRSRLEAGAVLEALPDPRPDPAARTLEAERRARLADAVRRLRPSLRQVVVLVLEGLPHAEIAEVLGISVNAVAIRLTRARAEMTALFEEGGTS